ncbi:MAG: hypothetical protein QHH30_00210 [candidate division NC10 bacterium]|nr:hypothetical protein [candidate division NC10 bacterium]
MSDPMAQEQEVIRSPRRDFSSLLDLPSLPAGEPVGKALIMGEQAEDLAIYLSARAASRGFQVLVADGANSFDPYLVSRFARREGLPPEELLKKIWVARAFTCHQMVTLLRERLDPMILPGALPLVVLLGPCTLFLDEEVSGEEATLLFRRMLSKVKERNEKGIFFLMGQPFSGLHRSRGFLLRELVQLSDTVLKLKPSPDALQIALHKPPLALRRRWGVLERFQEIA